MLLNSYQSAEQAALLNLKITVWNMNPFVDDDVLFNYDNYWVSTI